MINIWAILSVCWLQPWLVMPSQPAFWVSGIRHHWDSAEGNLTKMCGGKLMTQGGSVNLLEEPFGAKDGFYSLDRGNTVNTIHKQNPVHGDWTPYVFFSCIWSCRWRFTKSLQFPPLFRKSGSDPHPLIQSLDFNPHILILDFGLQPFHSLECASEVSQGDVVVIQTANWDEQQAGDLELGKLQCRERGLEQVASWGFKSSEFRLLMMNLFVL